jgi:hypothetical protein
MLTCDLQFLQLYVLPKCTLYISPVLVTLDVDLTFIMVVVIYLTTNGFLPGGSGNTIINQSIYSR